MALVTFISETGFAHAAVRVGSTWYGFKPRLPKMPVCPGFVDRSDSTAVIKHFVTFEFDDAVVRRAMEQVVTKYQTAWYRGGMQDCVNFVVDVAKSLGLKVPPSPNFLPDHFVQALYRLNLIAVKSAKIAN